MIDFAHGLDSIAHALQLPLVLLAVCGWAYAIITRVWPSRPLLVWEPRSRATRFVLGGLVFGGIIASFFAFDAVIKFEALKEIRPKLSSTVESVTIDGRLFEQPEKLAGILQGLHDAPAHHSHPTKTFEVRLDTARGPLTLHLCRDSDNPHEYWVFYPAFHSTDSNEVGRVFTDIFDSEPSVASKPPAPETPH